MNEALSKVKAALEKIDKAREVVHALCDGSMRWTMSVPARPEFDPDLVIADALRAAREALSAISNVEHEPVGHFIKNSEYGPWVEAMPGANGAVPLYTSPASGKDAELERAKTLLKATHDLLSKQREAHYVMEILAETVHYDDAECDGGCLLEDIGYWLEDAALAQKGGGNGRAERCPHGVSHLNVCTKCD